MADVYATIAGAEHEVQERLGTDRQQQDMLRA
jgi:hypothetical protein